MRSMLALCKNNFMTGLDKFIYMIYSGDKEKCQFFLEDSIS